ncbi:uncharacterized protein LOC127742674 [Arachis duranensis]|uniref:Uncharacterized protein LOC127742674 n=1 Tax=Arachis duranensis TaxID=130453 RepID=A0A9C6TCE4_ARADU|nr:uncharacterized protein LOC127742674 [Arachis duranensis]
MEFVYNALDQEIHKYEQELEKCKHYQHIRTQIQSLKKVIEAMKSTQQPKPSEFSQLSVVDKSENFQPIDQVQDLTIYSHEGRLASTLVRVFERTQKITRESHTRINYKSRNILFVSSKRNEIEEREMRLLVEFESAFYNLFGLLEKLSEGIKRNLCYLIKDREDHKCQLCVSELSEESNNETESTHMIKEGDNASEDHIMKEEDSTSEASLNIIA